MEDVAAVVDRYEGLSRKVLDYSLLMKRLVEEAKAPGFSAEGLAPLAERVAVDSFRRVGNFKEVMTWPEYSGFLARWASGAEWDCSFKRVTESGRVVFLELEERSRVGEHTSVVNSLSVYGFDADGRIERLDIYLQMEPMSPDMLAAYA